MLLPFLTLALSCCNCTCAWAGGSAVSGVEEVATMLQKNCPSYFKEDDRAFYQVG